jgi:hypothetical protein
MVGIQFKETVHPLMPLLEIFEKKQYSDAHTGGSWEKYLANRIDIPPLENPVTLADNLVTAGNLARILFAPANNQYNTQYRILRDNEDLTQNPPCSADFILTSDTIMQIFNHKYNLGDKATFYTTCPEFARYFFTPNPTYPYATISQLGHPVGEQPDEEAVHSDSDGD